MKLFLFFVPFFFFLSSPAQISAPGFEPSNETYVSTWVYEAAEGLSISAQQVDVHSGTFALRVRSTVPQWQRITPFSQRCTIAGGQAKRFHLSAWIKADDINGHAGIWCKVYDAQGKQLNSIISSTQNTHIDRNSNWKHSEIVLLVPPEAQSMKIGGYITGAGNYWFDDFEWKEAPPGKRRVSKKAGKYIAQAIRHVQSNSIYKDSIDWKSFTPEVMRMAAGIKTIEEAHLAVDYVMGRLGRYGDEHSRLQRPNLKRRNKRKAAAPCPPGKC